MTGGLSWWHWLIVLAVFILLFGAKKLPDAARGLGRSLRILKSEVSAMHDDDEKAKSAQASSAQPPAVVQPTPIAPPAAATTPVSPASPPAPQQVVNPVPVEDQQRT